MKKKQFTAVLLPATISISLLASCGASDQVQEHPLSQEQNATQNTDDEPYPCEYTGRGTVGDRWYSSTIIGAVTEDTVVDLKNDYFTAVNKEYYTGLTIEDGYTEAGVYADMDQVLTERSLSLLLDKEPGSHDAELAGSFYQLALDWDARDAAGFEPIIPSVERICGLSSIADITEYLTDTGDLFRSMLALIYVDNSLADPGNYTVYIDTTPLFLEDAGEYTQRSESGDLTADFIEKTLGYMLGRLGFSEEETSTIWEECEAFETAIAEHMLTYEDFYADDIYDRIINVYTLEELRGLQGNFPLAELLEADGLGGSDTYNLYEPQWLSGLSALYTEENVDMIRSYLLAQYVVDMRSMLDREAFDVTRGYLNEMYGITGALPEEEIGLMFVDSYLSDCLDYAYIDAYCTEEERQAVIDMVYDFLAYYRTMLEQEDWLSEETKQYAIEKLDHISVHACYSDTREDYSDLTFASKEEGGTYLEALSAIWQKDLAMTRESVNQKVDPDTWGMSTREVNAYYDCQDNSVNILCGMLLGPFSMDQSYEEVLATLGATVIGHEISHAFDTSGAQFDKDGNLADWWTEEDYIAFGERADRLVAYMSQIIPYEGAQPINGEMVEGEMIADLAGVKAALMIASEKEDFDYDMFFRALAYSYASLHTKNVIISLLQTDEHPLNNLRANISVQHCDEFLDTYDIVPGDGMYLAPEDRVSVW